MRHHPVPFDEVYALSVSRVESCNRSQSIDFSLDKRNGGGCRLAAVQ